MTVPSREPAEPTQLRTSRLLLRPPTLADVDPYFEMASDPEFAVFGARQPADHEAMTRVLFLFIVYHLLHFTVGIVHPAFEEGEVYRNVIVGFSFWPVAVAYVIAILALGLHLRHGAWSMLQTLGASHPQWDRLRNLAATAFTVIIVLGFISVPLAVLAGVLK